MAGKICNQCNIEKHTKDFHKKYSEYKVCNRTRGLKPYYENKDKKSIQQKLYYEKIRDERLLQKQNNRSIQIRDLARSCVELKKRLKTMEKNIKINDSEVN